MSQLTPFLDLPHELRMLEIFPRVSLGGCLRLPLVCRLFNHEISNEFLRKRCYAHFPELATIPDFIEPLLESVNNPWGWICYSLSCEKVNDELIPHAQKLAKVCLPRFQSYFERLTAQVQEKHARNLAQHKLLYATGEGDPNGLLFQFHQAYQTALTEQEMEELRDLNHQHPEQFQELGRILAQTPLKSTIREFDSQSLEEALNGDLKKRIAALFPHVRTVSRQMTRDPVVLRILELNLKCLPMQAHWHQLDRLGKELKEETLKQARILKKFLDIVPKLEMFAATTLHRILSHLPHMKNWLFLEPREDLILKISFMKSSTGANLLSDPSKIADIRALVDAFPPPCPGKIKDFLLKGQPEQNEIPWDYPRLVCLGDLLRAINFFSFWNLKGNPMLRPAYLSDFLSGEERLLFHVLAGHPDLEKRWKYFEETGSFHEGSLMKFM